jgi:hypothetical protein
LAQQRSSAYATAPSLARAIVIRDVFRQRASAETLSPAAPGGLA